MTQASEREPESDSLVARTPRHTGAKAEPPTPHRTPRTPDTALASPMPSTGRYSNNTGNRTARTIFETAASSVFNTTGTPPTHSCCSVSLKAPSTSQVVPACLATSGLHAWNRPPLHLPGVHTALIMYVSALHLRHAAC